MSSAYGDSAFIGPHGADLLALVGDGREIDQQEFRELLDASACGREPICIFGNENDGLWAEVYEREASTIAALGRFLVRLLLRDEGQYLVVLSDLPGLLAHLERLAGLLGRANVPSPARPRH